MRTVREDVKICMPFAIICPLTDALQVTSDKMYGRLTQVCVYNDIVRL